MTYKTLKLKIKPLTPFKTKFQSDTIFGVFAWNYKYIYGEDRFKKFLSEFDKKPSIVFSDGFFEGYLPRPFLKPLLLDNVLLLIDRFFEKKEISTDKKNIYLKAIKKTEYLKEDVIEDLLEKGLKEQLIVEAIIRSLDEKEEKKFETVSLLKNTVNRISGTVDEGLYQSNEVFYLTNIDIYVLFDEEKVSKNEIEEVFKAIGDFGFGADKSTGKGRFRLLEIQEDFPLKRFIKPSLFDSGKKAVFSLSSAFLEDERIELLFGKTFVKFGKLGGDKAFTGHHFKNPIVMYKPGSTFKVSEGKYFYGNATDRVFIDKQGFHNGYFIPLFFDYKEGEQKWGSKHTNYF